MYIPNNSEARIQEALNIRQAMQNPAVSSITVTALVHNVINPYVLASSMVDTDLEVLFVGSKLLNHEEFLKFKELISEESEEIPETGQG